MAFRTLNILTAFTTTLIMVPAPRPPFPPLKTPLKLDPEPTTYGTPSAGTGVAIGLASNDTEDSYTQFMDVDDRGYNRQISDQTQNSHGIQESSQTDKFSRKDSKVTFIDEVEQIPDLEAPQCHESEASSSNDVPVRMESTASTFSKQSFAKQEIGRFKEKNQVQQAGRHPLRRQGSLRQSGLDKFDLVLQRKFEQF